MNDSSSTTAPGETPEFVKNSVLYKEFLAEREEILCHKWLESEKAGYDIGFERALLDWIVRHRSEWRQRRRKQLLEAQQKEGNSLVRPPSTVQAT